MNLLMKKKTSFINKKDPQLLFDKICFYLCDCRRRNLAVVTSSDQSSPNFHLLWCIYARFNSKSLVLIPNFTVHALKMLLNIHASQYQISLTQIRFCLSRAEITWFSDTFPNFASFVMCGYPDMNYFGEMFEKFRSLVTKGWYSPRKPNYGRHGSIALCE